MSKKVYFGKIKGSFVTMLSDYNQALFALKDLKTDHKAKLEELNNKLENLKTQRAEAVESGECTPDEAVAKYDALPITTAINAEDAAYKKACEPHNKAIKLLQATIPDELYYAYVLSGEKGMNAKGKVTVGKSTYVVDKSFKGILKGWLEDIGVVGADSDTALNKFAEVMALGVAGLKKQSNLEKGYVKRKASSEYKDLVIRYMIQVLVIDKGVLSMAEDYSLTK